MLRLGYFTPNITLLGELKNYLGRGKCAGWSRIVWGLQIWVHLEYPPTRPDLIVVVWCVETKAVLWKVTDGYRLVLNHCNGTVNSISIFFLELIYLRTNLNYLLPAPTQRSPQQFSILGVIGNFPQHFSPTGSSLWGRSRYALNCHLNT